MPVLQCISAPAACSCLCDSYLHLRVRGILHATLTGSQQVEQAQGRAEHSEMPAAHPLAHEHHIFQKIYTNKEADLLHGVPQHLLDLGSHSSHCSRLQLPELSRVGC